MKKLGIVILILMLGLVLKASNTSYIITPELNKEHAIIKVELLTQADKNGHINLTYYDETWGEEDLFKCLSYIKVHDQCATIIRYPFKNEIQILTESFANVKIEYGLIQDYEGIENIQDYYRPIINKKYFHVFGHRMFLIPSSFYHGSKTQSVDITLNYSDGIVQHSFGTERTGTYTLTKEDLMESIIVGGDFRRINIKLDDLNIYFLTRGKWASFDDKDLEFELRKIINAQRDFWNDYADEIYTITLLPFEESEHAYIGGTGLSKGFASYCSNSERSKLKDITGLYYHELMHHWIGGKIRNASLTDELWFSEGFTEYFSHLLMLEAKEITSPEYAELLNNKYQALKKKGIITNQELNFESFATGGSIEKIPYQRGEIYALYLDQKMFEHSQGTYRLRDFMLEILEDAEKDAFNFTNDYFIEKLVSVLGEEASVDFQNLIIDGKLIPISQLKGEFLKVIMGSFIINERITFNLSK